MILSAKQEGLLITLVLCATVFAAGWQLRQDVDAEQDLTAKRLAHAFMPLLAKAHQAKDDLALQEDVMALAQAPGISMACVVDADDKIIAHNHLAQLGKIFEGLRNNEDVHRIALKEGSVRWGMLVFTLSENSLRHVWLHWLLLFSTIGLGIGIFYNVRLCLESRRLGNIRRALADQTTLGQEKEKMNQHLEMTLTEIQRQAGTGFRVLLAQWPAPIVLLDAQQRVVAFNAEADRLLEFAQKEVGLQTSWQDVPWVQDQGAALEQSLQTPNTDVHAEDGRYEGTFRTEEAWTWVTPRPALRAYR